MNSKKHLFRQLVGWAAAAAAAVLLCNGLLYAYHHPSAWIDRRNAATNGILTPHSTTLQGTEGRGRHTVDARGYLNPDLPLAEDYILVMGSSYVQGKEVKAGRRFIDRMNDALSPSGQELAVYSVSQDGLLFPQMVQCFQALIQEFPDAGTIILEVNANSYSPQSLMDCLEQYPFDPGQTGQQLMQSLSARQKLVIRLKEWFPILNLGKTQLTAMLSSNGSGSAAPAAAEEPECSMAEAIDAAVALLREQYAGQLILFYHPDVDIQPDGSMTLEADEKAGLYRQACEAHGVGFVDISEAFLDAYRRDYTVPYGFSNTTMGSGHFNEAGHRICADILVDAVKGGEGA